MKVWVIMGNDFPDAVRGSEKEADEYIDAKRKLDPHHGVKYMTPRIHWRSYEFNLPEGEK